MLDAGPFLQGKKSLVTGVANANSVAYAGHTAHVDAGDHMLG